MPAGFGAIGLYHGRPFADGTSLSFDTAMYGNRSTWTIRPSLESVTLPYQRINVFYDCIYGGNGTGPFTRPFADISTCAPKTTPSVEPTDLHNLVREAAKYAAPQAEAEAEVPGRFQLEQNYPNPFNPQTTIRFGLQEAATVQLTVYDILGRPVQTLIEGTLTQGWHEATFNAATLPSGLYLYRLTTPMGTIHQTMTLTK